MTLIPLTNGKNAMGDNYNTNLFNFNLTSFKTSQGTINSSTQNSLDKLLFDFDVKNLEKTQDSNIDLLNEALKEFNFSYKEEEKTTAVDNPLELINEEEIDKAQSVLVNIGKKYNNSTKPFDLTQQNQAFALDILVNNLDSIKNQYKNQQDEDGIVSQGFNLLKELTNIGVDSKEVEEAIELQSSFIAELQQALNKESDLSFEQVWKNYTGQEFSIDKIIDYQQCANEYSILYSGLQKANQFEHDISKAASLKEVLTLYTEFYGDEELGREKLVEYLKDGYLIGQESFSTIKSIDINDKNELVIVNADDYVAYNDEKDLNFTTTVYKLDDTANLLLQMYDYDKDRYSNEFLDTIEKTLGKDQDAIVSDYQKARKNAFNKADSVQNLINKYCSSQEGFAKKLAGTLQIGGLCLVAAGAATSFVCPPAGLAMMNAGKYSALTGMFSDNAIELVDNLTSRNGLSKEEGWNLAKDTIKELLLYFSGKGINKAAQGVKNLVLTETQSQVLAALSEIGADASLSLITDLVLIGEINVEGEAISQLLGILTGVSGAKVNSYYKNAYDSANYKIEQNDINGAIEGLKKAGLKDNQIKTYLDNFTTKEYSNAYELLKLGIDEQFCSKISQLDENSYKQALDFIDKGIPASKAASALCDETTINRINDLLENHPSISKYYAADIALLDSYNYKQALELIENENYNAAVALKAISEGDDMYYYLMAVDDGLVRKEITNEVEAKLLAMAKELQKEYSSADSIENKMSEIFNTDESYVFSYRAKGIDSTLAKLKKGYEIGKVKPDDINSARKTLKDALGTRIQMNSINKTYTSSIIKESTSNKVTYEELNSVLNDCIKNNSDLSELPKEYLIAIDALKEVQNKETFDALYNAVKNSEIELTELHNYGNQLSSYFTNRQLVDLAQVYAQTNNNEKFLKLNTIDNLKEYREVDLDTVNNYKEGDNIDFLNNFNPEKCDSAMKESGYTSCQMNIVYKKENGTNAYGEFQIRGKEVNAFADIEHIPYDIRMGKITAADKEYLDIYTTIKNMSQNGYDNYNEYLNQTYEYLRLKELGFDIEKPKLKGPIQTIKGTYLDKEALSKIDYEGLSKFAH